MCSEVWSLIPSNHLGFENTIYFASSEGRVKKGDKILKQTPFIKTGYLSVSINRKRKRVHVIVANTFIENPENKQYVDHGDNDVTNNAVWNLRWVTHQENMELKKLRGNKRRPNAKFSSFQYHYVLSMKGVKTSRELAIEVGVLPEHISNLWRGWYKPSAENDLSVSNPVVSTTSSQITVVNK